MSRSRRSSPAPRGAPWRLVAATLLGTACVLAPLALSAVWLRNEVFDTNAYVRTVAPLSANPAIDAAVATELTTQLFNHVDVASEARRVLPANAGFLAYPLAVGVRDYTQQAIDRVLASQQFRRVWVFANQQAHAALAAVLEGRRSVYLAADGSVAIDLRAAASLVRGQLRAAGLQVFKDVPNSLLQRRFVIVRARSLQHVRVAVVALRTLAVALPAAALLLAALGLALSRGRRRTLVRFGFGLAAVASARPA